MGALRPDLPIEAMIKIKMVSAEAEVLRLDTVRFTPTHTSDLERQAMNSISEAHLRSAKFSYVLNYPYCTRMYTHPFFEATPPGAAPGPPVKKTGPVFATSGGVTSPGRLTGPAPRRSWTPSLRDALRPLLHDGEPQQQEEPVRESRRWVQGIWIQAPTPQRGLPAMHRSSG